MPERTFNLYNKSGTKVASGKSPLKLLELVEDTDYQKGDYTITAQEYSSESTHVDVPAFRTKVTLKLTIDGTESTGTYLTKDISQADYLTLATKDANTLYRVQPTDSGSGRVHFLGDKIVDLTKKGDSILYARNLLNGTSDEWKEYTFSGWNTETLDILNLADFDLKEGDLISARADIDNSLNALSRVYLNVGFYNGSTRISVVPISRINVSTAGRSEGEAAIPEGTTRIIINALAKPDNTNVVTVKVKNIKVIKGALATMDEWTLSPADLLIIASTSGGGTFG